MDRDDLELRLGAIEARLDLIERRNAPRATLFAEDPPPSRPARPETPASPPMARPWVETAVETTTAPIPEIVAKPGSWLGLIAIACFVLAAGFIVKLSIESGWLTPERQIGLAALLGLALIGGGLALMERDREYASYLPAAGVIVLHVANFAAHGGYGYYQITSFEVALALSAIISGGCVWLYTEIEHDLYAITAAIGAYGAPILLGLGTDAEFTLLYFLICSLAFATISVWVESRTLSLVASYLALITTGLVGQRLPLGSNVAALLALIFVIFATGTYLHTRRVGQPLTESESQSFLPVLLMFYALEYWYISREYPGLAPWVSLGFAALLLGLAVSARALFPDRPFASWGVVSIFITIVVFHSVYLELLPPVLHPWLFVALIVVATFVPRVANARSDRTLAVPVLTVAMVLGIEFINMAFRLLTRPDPDLLLVALAAFAALWVNLALGAADRKRDEHHLVLFAAHSLAILGFYRLSEPWGSLAVSASWLVYAGAVIAFAFARRDVVMAKSALFVLSFAAAKALLYDASSAPTGLRIVCLLLTGAVLYGSGFLIRQISEWSTKNSPTP